MVHIGHQNDHSQRRNFKTNSCAAMENPKSEKVFFISTRIKVQYRRIVTAVYY